MERQSAGSPELPRKTAANLPAPGQVPVARCSSAVRCCTHHGHAPFLRLGSTCRRAVARRGSRAPRLQPSSESGRVRAGLRRFVSECARLSGELAPVQRNLYRRVFRRQSLWRLRLRVRERAAVSGRLVRVPVGADRMLGPLRRRDRERRQLRLLRHRLCGAPGVLARNVQRRLRCRATAVRPGLRQCRHQPRALRRLQSSVWCGAVV